MSSLPLLGAAHSSTQPLESESISMFSRVKSFCGGFHKYGLFGYFTPFMRLAKEKGSNAVRPETLPKLWPSDNLEKWTKKFVSVADRRRQSSKKTEWALLNTLFSVFWLQFGIVLAVKMTTTLLSLTSIILMGRFLKWQEEAPASSTIAERNQGLLAGAGVLALELINILGGAQANFWIQRVGIRVQGVLVAGLFRRVIRSPEDTAQKSREGPQASSYNLLMVDVPSISDFVFSSIDLMILPFRVALSFQVLHSEVGAEHQRQLHAFYEQVGTSALVSLVSLLGTVAIILYLEIQSGILKSPYLRNRDVRIAKCHEALDEIRVLRMIGWEGIASQSINDARAAEISYRKKRMYLDAAASALSNAAYAITQITIFAAYVIWGLQSNTPFVFKASVAIPVMLVVGRLVGPLTNFPFTINSIIEGFISAERYERYLFGSTIKPSPSSRSTATSSSTSYIESQDDMENERYPINRRQQDDSFFADAEFDESQGILIRVDNCRFTWRKDPLFNLSNYSQLGESGTTPVVGRASPEALNSVPIGLSQLRRAAEGFQINVPHLEVNRGQCVAVVGLPGSGKTCLLLALLGEMLSPDGNVDANRWRILKEGDKHFNKPVGYAPQTAWLPAGTVQSAILFGRKYDQENYNKVIAACELLQDFAAWSEGDQRVISEGASNLSGGQRSRVALARAIYTTKSSNFTNVYLLDDPLASIDPSAASMIFQNLFGPEGFLIHAAVVLTIDETTLRFLLDSMRTNGVQPGLHFTTRVIQNGTLTDKELEGCTVGELYNQPPVLQRSKFETLQSWDRPRDHGDLSIGNTEQAFSGVVGKPTYSWYSARVGWLVLVSMALTIVVLHLAGMGADFWIAHWTRLATLNPSNQSGTIEEASKTKFKPSITEVREDPSQGTSSLIHTGEEVVELPVFFETNAAVRRRQQMEQYSLQGDPISQPSFLQESSKTYIPPTESTSARDSQNKENLSALVVFTGFSVADIVAVFVLYMTGTFGALKAAVDVHKRLLKSVVNAPFWLYDFLPLGVILNRFSADMEVVDGGPLYTMSYFLGSCFHVLLTVIALTILSPWCTPLIPFIGFAVYFGVYRLYRPTCREFQRSKLLALSPLCGNLSEAESGAVVIRAFGAENYYKSRNMHLTENLMKAQFMQVGSNNWASTRLQLLAFPFTILNCVLPVYLQLLGLSSGAGLLKSLLTESKTTQGQTAGFVGLAISFALALPSSIGAVMWSISLLEQKMCSVQRVREITRTMEPPSLHLESEGRTDEQGRHREIILRSISQFQTRTGLELIDVSVSYQRLRDVADDIRVSEEENLFSRENLHPSLMNISAQVKPTEHIGIVGRTGSGKSTLLLALLNLVPTCSGTILLDDTPLPNISRNLLRHIVGVLPQSPFILKGWTYRQFLDPDGLYTEERIYSALHSVRLGRLVQELPLGLDSVIIHDIYDSILAVDQSPEPAVERKLSDSQIRLLSLARLSLNASHYRLVLVDEPPPKQILSDKTKDVSRGMRGEQGASLDINESDSGWQLNPDEIGEEYEVADLLKSVFPNCMVIIVAHHANTLKNCNRVWILSRGKLAAQLDASKITSQEHLTKVISSCEI